MLTCDKCGQSFEDNYEAVQCDFDPSLYFNNLAQNMFKNKGPNTKLYYEDEKFVGLKYHIVFFGYNHKYLCGPMHKETDEEYYVRRYLTGKP